MSSVLGAPLLRLIAGAALKKQISGVNEQIPGTGSERLSDIGLKVMRDLARSIAAPRCRGALCKWCTACPGRVRFAQQELDTFSVYDYARRHRVSRRARMEPPGRLFGPKSVQSASGIQA